MSTRAATRSIRNKTVWEEISGGNDIIKLGKREMNSRAYSSAFNFKGADQQQKVGNLSGGQRNRVHLAKMLKSGANVLLLDEPTNDLDTETLAALEDALEDFAGCAVIISHDRMFLDRLATHILAFEGDSHVEWFEGNFEDYEQDKIRRLGPGQRQPAPGDVQAADAVAVAQGPLLAIHVWRNSDAGPETSTRNRKALERPCQADWQNQELLRAPGDPRTYRRPRGCSTWRSSV